MSLFDKVAWKDGMFLLPQHFQQEARHTESALRQLLLGTQPLGWGVVDLSLDQQALVEGRVELLSCRAIWPDGTPYHAPSVDPTPPPLSIPSSTMTRRFDVYLTLPARRPQVALLSNAASAESVGDGGFWESTEGVVEGNFEGVELAEAVGVSEYHFGFVVEALDDAGRQSALCGEPV